MNIHFNVGKLVANSGFRSLWIFIFAGCLSPIEFPTDNLGNRLIISGQVSPIPDQNIIEVGLTASTERLPIPLSGAEIHLFDDSGNSFLYTENLAKPGKYLLTEFSGTPGSTYYIRVITPEGETYESRPERMPAAAGILDTHYDIVTEEYTDIEGIISQQRFIKLFVNSTLPTLEEPTFLKWHVQEDFLLSPTDFPDPFGTIPPPCFVTMNADPQRITLFNGDELKTQSIDRLLVASRIIDWTFLERHYFTTYQSAITRDAHEYWRKVNILANQVGSIFDTPPAEISGNIQNVNNPTEKVLGYFQASYQVFDRIFLVKQDLPFPLLIDCVYDGRNFRDYPQRCLDCLSVPNSSYDRPSWF